MSNNTPIFDELYREFKAAGKDYDRLATPFLQAVKPLSEMPQPEYGPNPILDAPVKKIGHWLEVPEQLPVIPDLMLRFKEAADNARIGAGYIGGVKLQKPPADVLYISEEALKSPEPVTYDEMVDVIHVIQESNHRLGEAVKAVINTYLTNEQTDEAVNAALSDSKTNSTPIPAGLMVSDEEVADEE